VGIHLGDAALRRLFGAAGELVAAGPTPAIADVLGLVAESTPCDVVSWSRLDVARRLVLDGVTYPAEAAEQDAGLEEAFWRVYHEHPLCHGIGEQRPVCRISEVIDRRAWHRTAIYAEYFRVGGSEHQLGIKLSHPPGQTNVLLLDRGPGRDFDEHDVLVLTLLRPHLDAAIRRITDRRPRLTLREREILGLVRQGLTNQAIARRLAVSPHTVRKHLENAFSRLDVHSRTAAVVAVASDGAPA
jgi:DNA-binding CsgD family transcriptional regulator